MWRGWRGVADAGDDEKWCRKDARLLVSLHFRAENQAETEAQR